MRLLSRLLAERDRRILLFKLQMAEASSRMRLAVVASEERAVVVSED